MEDFEPAILYAENGFPVSELVSYYLEISARNFSKYPNFNETYLINGLSPTKGQIFKNPDLANTLRIISKEGRSGFYEGKVAKIISEFIIEQGGFLSYEDLKNHKSDWVEPVSTNYRGYDVWELLQMDKDCSITNFKSFRKFDIKSMGFGSAEYIHHFVEAKIAFADRAKYYADMDFNDIPVDYFIKDTQKKVKK